MKRPRKRGSSVAVIDIGSNSVRLVVYEGLTRSLIPIFNEKTLCGLGREVQSTGLLAPDAALRRAIGDDGDVAQPLLDGVHGMGDVILER